MVETEARRRGYEDGKHHGQPCPPNGPGYIPYMDGFNDGRAEWRNM